ncbi:MAG: sensor histidine kinase [Bryobacteraceae bacterium]
MNFSSLRVRLTAWYFFSLALILSLFAAGAWIGMKRSITEAVDHDLRQRIRDVREFTQQQLNVSAGELMEEFREHSLLGLGGGLLQVSDGNGRVLFRSARLGGARLDFQKPDAALPTVRYTTQRAGHSDVRIASERVEVKGQLFTIQVAEPMHEFEESLERFEGLLLILAPVFLVLASVGGFWMSSRALSPVDRITNDARQISIANLSARLQVPRAKDELQRLTQTLNEMLDRIDTAVRRIVQFTADASHELRTPLTLIHTAAEFSLRRERTREELVGALRKIVRESERTSRLVDDLLLLARADSGTDELRLAATDLTATGMDAAGQAVTLAEPKNIRVVTEIPDQPVVVNGDEQALARLWLILLDNAVKYTNEGGQITFAIHAGNSHAEAIVSDSGIGIAPADLPHVYDRFWRADKVRSRSLGGAGLGLAIARWIVQRHGGEIEIGSEPGRGSRVLVRLPLAG